MSPTHSNNPIVGMSGAQRRGAISEQSTGYYLHSPNLQTPGTCDSYDCFGILYDSAYEEALARFPALGKRYSAAIREVGPARRRLGGERRACGHGEHDNTPLKEGWGVPCHTDLAPLRLVQEEYLIKAHLAIHQPTKHQDELLAFLRREFFEPRPEYYDGCAECAVALEVRELMEVETMFDLLVETMQVNMKELLEGNEAPQEEVERFQNMVAEWQGRWDRAWVESSSPGQSA